VSAGEEWCAGRWQVQSSGKDGDPNPIPGKSYPCFAI
jgi:hypothetical protein